MRVFVRVAQLSGFAAAARELRMSTAAVTKHVAALESRVGARLLERTTRTVRLTETGRIYLERCLECLQTFDDADVVVRELSKSVSGTLRVTAPIEYGALLSSYVATLMSTYPDLKIHLSLNDRIVDLVEDGIDVGLRVAVSLDARYVARPLAKTRLVLCGSPAYLDKYGRPRTPAALKQHRHIVFTEPSPRDVLVLMKKGKREQIKVDGSLMGNNGDALRVAARDGVGLAVMPTFLAFEDLRAGRLEAVLPDWEMPFLRVFVVYPQRRFLAPKVRAFVDGLRALYPDPDADPWASAL